MPFSFYLYFNGLYFNGCHLLMAGTSNMHKSQLPFLNYMRGGGDKVFCQMKFCKMSVKFHGNFVKSCTFAKFDYREIFFPTSHTWNYSIDSIKLKLKCTVQRKLTGVLSGINRQLMICQSVAWYFFFKFKEPWPFKFKKTFFSGLINF
jgi:hypothetical protein